MATNIKIARNQGKTLFRYRNMLAEKPYTLISKEDYPIEYYQREGEPGLKKLIIYGNTKHETKYYFKFNQLIKRIGSEVIEKNGLTFTSNGDGSFTISGKATAYTTFSVGATEYVEGHVYYVKSGIRHGDIQATDSNLPFFFLNYGYMQKEHDYSLLFTSTKTDKLYNILYVGPGKEFVEPVTLYPMCIDVTEMYGAGFEPNYSFEVEHFYGDNYYPYNEGEYQIKENPNYTYVTAYETPSEEFPKLMQNSGDNFISIATFAGDFIAEISGFSLRKIGDKADVLYLDALKKKVMLVRKIGVIESYNGEEIKGDYLSSTGELTNGATIYYVLDQPDETDVTSNVEGHKLLGLLNLSGEIGMDILSEPVGGCVPLSKVRIDYWVKQKNKKSN